MTSSFPYSQVPEIKTEPPGPHSKAVLDRQRELTYLGAEFDSNPFVAVRKADYAIEDLDGNVYIDMSSGWGSTPLGAAHPAVREATLEALPRFGVEDSHHLASAPMLPSTTCASTRSSTHPRISAPFRERRAPSRAG